MTSSLEQAQAALNAGDFISVSVALGNYYGVQVNNPSDGSIMRGYASLAKSVAGNYGAGRVPNEEVRSAVGPATYTDQFRMSLAYSLARADRDVVQANGGQVPTLSDDATYHDQVFSQFDIPITAWGGTAYTALGQDFTLGRATAAERNSITTTGSTG